MLFLDSNFECEPGEQDVDAYVNGHRPKLLRTSRAHDACIESLVVFLLHHLLRLCRQDSPINSTAMELSRAIPKGIAARSLASNGSRMAAVASPMLIWSRRQFTTGSSSSFPGPQSMGFGGSGSSSPAYFQRSQSLPANTIIRFVPQQTAWIVERMGKFNRILSPGLAILIPIIDVSWRDSTTRAHKLIT
jgi:hypothetical protein